MYKILCCSIIIFSCVFTSFAGQGYIVLKTGQKIKGEIVKKDKGSYWLYQDGNAVVFDKNEIKSVSIVSNTDRSSQRFSSFYTATPSFKRSVSSRTPYENVIQEAARKHNVDPALVKAVIKAESNFNPLDRSCKGACGLMQLMPKTAKVLGVSDIYSPDENIHAGTRFLKDMIYTFNGDTEKALAAYNAGPGAVKKFRSIPPYKETIQYVKNVFRYYNRYKNNSDTMQSYTDSTGCLNIYNVK